MASTTQRQSQPKTQNNQAETSSIVSLNNTTSSNISLSVSRHSSSETSSTLSSNSKSTRNIKSAAYGKSMPPTRSNIRAATAKAKKQGSPNLPKDREQGKAALNECLTKNISICISFTFFSCENVEFGPNKRHLCEFIVYFFNLKKSAAEAVW